MSLHRVLSVVFILFVLALGSSCSTQVAVDLDYFYRENVSLCAPERLQADEWTLEVRGFPAADEMRGFIRDSLAEFTVEEKGNELLISAVATRQPFAGAPRAKQLVSLSLVPGRYDVIFVGSEAARTAIGTLIIPRTGDSGEFRAIEATPIARSK